MPPQEGLWVDVRRLLEGLSSASNYQADNRLYDDMTRLPSTIDLSKGKFLADFYLSDSNEFEEWAAIEREHLLCSVLDALDRWMTYSLDEGNYETAQTAAWKQIGINNLRESA